MSNLTGKLLPSEDSLKRRQKEERIKFGQNLKERRRLLNLTQENVAEMLRITVTAYSKIERGETGVNMDRMRQLAHVLDMDMHELVENRPIGNLMIKELYLGMQSLKEDLHVITEILVSESEARYDPDRKHQKPTSHATKSNS